MSAVSAPAGLVDQEYAFDPNLAISVAAEVNGNANRTQAQGFTVGLDGLLTGVEVLISRFNTNSVASELTVNIVEVGNSGELLPDEVRATTTATPTVPGSGFDVEFVAFTFDTPLAVTIGEMLAIQLVSDAPRGNGYRWASASQDGGYDGGVAYINGSTNPTQDFGFRTFVAADQVQPIPLPAAGWMLLAGVGGLIAAGTRRNA